ncbi:coniferyl aldehyde dehydrogenase [Aliidiomarina haloalkalitolerans]|uniref:Aldehyde dehydrogenase n=1 Tax=Aliidiomarina haloalkalitolerans TaxID=859059 RepID=A0A432VVX3_9GAMM|nr:coniferyl aldehyde dehydrogenase [Aliidiomarina haloalkalitolerans]RUO20708.1 coniferyl-aldehyde dehydrogenase [Aliidiomarina haloalkalitolerans]
MTTVEELSQLFAAQKTAFAASPFPTANTRIENLEKLRLGLLAHQEALIKAIDEDFGRRSADETRLAELLPSVEGIRYAQKRIKRWMRPSRRKVGTAFQPARARVEYQPLGVVGIIVPWNYPLYLAIGPLVAALSAGNRVLIKMSEFTPATAAAIQELIAECFTPGEVSVVTGDVDIGQAFSELPFDHLLFTGGTNIGRHVMQAAAKNLTPVTLELGGKSPAIIGNSRYCDLPAAAERIAFAKALNAGQTCVAPDYILCPREQVDELIAELKTAFKNLYPSLQNNPDYSWIINQRQFDRLHSVLQDAISRGADVHVVNPKNETFTGSRLIPPTIVNQVNSDMKIMQDEIFGPILPIVAYDNFDQALKHIRGNDRPLALYYFGDDQVERQQVLESTHSGGVCFNEAVFHVAQDDLPFGGVGASGMGRYHGDEGFLTFSNARAVLSKGKLNSAKLIYPPYGGKLLGMIYKLFIR